MSNLLQLQSGWKSFGSNKLFEDASFAINDNEHVGVIGPNGAGKTTLFKILASEQHLDSGEVVKAKTLRIGYLAQHDHWSPDDTVTSYLSSCVMPIWDLKKLGHGLGISEDMFSYPIASFSGGYRMRCKLLYLIGQEPNLMLLDEPTNYLDLETTLVLENFLQGYKGAFLLISHDREFLKRTTDHILEVEQGTITKYNGNIDDYFEQKELLRNQLAKRALSIKEKRDEVLAFVARFGAKATKASQAQSRLKSLDRLETIELKPLSVGAHIRIPRPPKAGKIIGSIEGANIGYGEKVVLKNVNFILNNGDHLAVVGLNGSGKSTFLKALAKKLAPMTGKVELGYQVSLGYYAQHVAESLNPEDTVINAMTAQMHPSLSWQECLNMAGSLLFSGDDVKKKVAVLSGGEKSRVALGQILLKKSPFLVLDEPTNHLDFQTVEALTQALMSYSGTVAVVSHDRGFIGRVGTKIVEINNGRVEAYNGTYDEYVWSLEKGILSQRGEEKQNPSLQQNQSTTRAPVVDYRMVKKELERELRQTKKRIGELDKNLVKLHAQVIDLNERLTNNPGPEMFKMIKQLSDTQAQVTPLESEWITLSEKCEKLESTLQSLTNS